MMKRFEKFTTISTLSRIIFLYIVFIYLVSARLTSEFDGAVDVFHQGEMLGNYWHMLGYYRGVEGFPTLIHGAMDYWPSAAAGYFFGDDNIIYGTRLVVVCVTFASWLIFAFTGIRILRNAYENNPYILVFLAVFLLTLPLYTLKVMPIEEAPVGFRDLFLLSQISFLIHFYLSKEKNLYLLAAAFLILPATLYWSYDRGLAAAFACFALLGYLLVSKRHLQFGVALASLIISTTVFEVTRIAGSISENVANIIHWGKFSGEIWGTEFALNSQGIASLFPLLFIAAIFVRFFFLHRARQNPATLGLIVFIFVAEVIMVKSAFNRPNVHRALMSVWPTALLSLWLLPFRTSLGADTDKYPATSGSGLLKLSFAPLILAVMYFSFPHDRLASFRSSLRAPPTDEMIAGSSLVQVANRLKGDKCSLNMVNQGVIALLSKTTHCTDFPNLVYAGKNNQRDIIRKMEASDVSAIVIDSRDWSSSIDGRSMQSRLPELNLFLASRFPQRRSVANYVVLQK